MTTVKSSFLEVGKKYFIRTATYFQVGELVAFNDMELLITKACFIPDTGRFYDALKNGKFLEVEPFVNDVLINRYAVIDITEWKHPLPDSQQ